MSNLKLAKDLISTWPTMQSIEVGIWGGDMQRRIYERMVSRHPKFPIFRLKTVGVALIELPETVEEYVAGDKRRLVRNRGNKALKAGYSFSRMDPAASLDDVLAVNLSNVKRQGGELPRRYTDPAEVAAWSRQEGDFFCVRDKERKVVAYIHGVDLGEVYSLDTVIGHFDYLQDGVVWLLIRETVKECIARRRNGSSLRYVMYDMYLGALEGLRFFKQQMGFLPYRVKWRWLSAAPAAQAIAVRTAFGIVKR